MRHPDDGTLQALLDGEIPSDELASITTHLAECAECRARLDAARAMMTEADALVASLGDGASAAPATVIPIAAPSRLPLYRRLAWAATVVIATGLGFQVGRQGAPPATDVTVSGRTFPLAFAAESLTAPVEVPLPTTTEDRAASPPRRAPRTAATPPAAGDPPTTAADAVAETTARAEAFGAQTQKAADPVVERARVPFAAGSMEVRRMAPATEPAAPMALTERVQANVAVESFAPIDFAEAIARLGGTIRLVDGLVPDRLEASAAMVRVVYPLETGELVLEQRRIGDSISVALRGPVSAESLAVLRRRVR